MLVWMQERTGKKSEKKKIDRKRRRKIMIMMENKRTIKTFTHLHTLICGLPDFHLYHLRLGAHQVGIHGPRWREVRE